MAATTHREIRVDRTLCMGSGQCSWYAPNTFDQDDETIAIVIDPRGDPADKIQNAVDSCPTGALSIVSDDEASDGEARDKDKDGQ
jgi:ferredoxin